MNTCTQLLDPAAGTALREKTVKEADNNADSDTQPDAQPKNYEEMGLSITFLQTISKPNNAPPHHAMTAAAERRDYREKILKGLMMSGTTTHPLMEFITSMREQISSDESDNDENDGGDGRVGTIVRPSDLNNKAPEDAQFETLDDGRLMGNAARLVVASRVVEFSIVDQVAMQSFLSLSALDSMRFQHGAAHPTRPSSRSRSRRSVPGRHVDTQKAAKVQKTREGAKEPIQAQPPTQ